MTLFNQLVPRLTRAVSRDQSSGSNAATETEYTIKPLYELKETEEAWGLTVQLPGVAKDGLELSVEDNVISLRGRRAWQKPEGWTPLYRESVDAPYALSLEHDNSVDVDKIHAELKDGVLRVSLPKAEAVKPRKIAVN
ncbi:MAG TPA: Hsp20/alpha crystallin family protein [Acidobacteriota bacterium]|nr:Hsp20/alpha crystallin family protein [Acidobacteriota bacterium]